MNNNFNQFGMPINNLPMSGINPFGANGNTPYMAPTKPMEYDSVSFSNRQQLKPSFWDQTKMFFSQYGTKIFGWGATILGGLGAFALGKKFINLDVPYGKNAPKPSEDASLMAKAKYHLCTFLSDTVGVMKPYEAPAKTEEDQKETDEIDVNAVVTKLENLINAPTPDINTLKSTVEILKNSLNGLKSSADLEHKIDELKKIVDNKASLTQSQINDINKELEEIKTLLQPTPTVPVTSEIKPSKALEDIKTQCDKIFQSGLKFKTCKFNSMSLTKSNKESITLRNFVNLNAYTDDKINSTTIENATSIGIDNIEALEILRHSYYKNKDTISISTSTSTSTSNIISAENFFANIVSLAKFKLGNSDFNYDKQNIAIDSALKLFYDIAKNKFGNLNKAEDVDNSFIILSNEIDELININNINDENQKNAKLLKQYIAICKVETKVNIFKNLDVTSLTDTNEFNKYKLSKEELDLLTDKSEYVKKLSNIAEKAGDPNVKTAAINAKVNIFKNLEETEYDKTFTSAADLKNYLLSDVELKSLNTATKAEYVKKLSNIAEKTTELEVKTTVFNALINQKDVKKQMISKNQLNITYTTLPLQYTFTLEKLSMPPADFSAYSKNTFILNGTQIYFKNHTKQYFKVTKFMIKT